MDAKISVLLMRVGMLLLVAGAVIFFLTGNRCQPMVNHILVWACAVSTAIFVAGTSAIKRLRNQIEEIEEKGTRKYTPKKLADDLDEIRSILK
ncbi:MAG: hypothetical protein JRI79_08720 [Deltaproteobacteria bacterium]|nr:hypothetical protein [Deltaproteobacteria bacterium]MBW2045649.1 hypothetical protein [Deltaproteobacteria bacterium]MBW2301571.1 hypothetical protein [Deltaproteobacteria bacterium]